jgi:hypothetical protein
MPPARPGKHEQDLSREIMRLNKRIEVGAEQYNGALDELQVATDLAASFKAKLAKQDDAVEQLNVAQHRVTAQDALAATAKARVAELEGYIRAICDQNPAISTTIIDHSKPVKPESLFRVDDPNDGKFVRGSPDDAWRNRR